MTQEFVTLPRHVAEHAVASIEILNAGKWTQVTALAAALRAALEQPKNHVPDAGNMVTAGWKLVPIEPTDDMLYDIQEFSHILPPRGKRIWAHMLAAAPQPPTTKESSVVQPQAEQPAMTPIAQRKLDDLVASGYTISGYSIYHEQKHQHGFVTGAGLVGWWKPEGMEYPQPQGEQEPVAKVVLTERLGLPCLQWLDLDKQFDFKGGEFLYTHPQPKREPLTDEQIGKIGREHEKFTKGGSEWFDRWTFARAIEAAHNIK